MGRVDEASGRIPIDFLRLIGAGEWDKASAMVADEFEGYLPQTSEQMTGPEAFVGVLRLELAGAEAQIQNHQFSYEVWDKEYEVAVQVLVTPTDGGPKRHKHFGIDKGNLNKEIDAVGDNQMMPGEVVEALHLVRQYGNFGAHSIAGDSGVIVDVQDGEADFMIELLDMLIDHAFVKPAKLEAIKASLEAKLPGKKKRDP